MPGASNPVAQSFEYPTANKEYPISKEIGITPVFCMTTGIFPAPVIREPFLRLDIPCWTLDIPLPPTPATSTSISTRS